MAVSRVGRFLPVAATAIGAFYLGMHVERAYLTGSVIDLDCLTREAARSAVGKVLDKAGIAHGDTAFPSAEVHSGRYLVTQWQRSAAGATVIVLGKDEAGELCVALGPQRGKMRHPQGYMESPLPKDDMTGLAAKGASRINKTTGELVMADHSLEDNAIREVLEEIGVVITKDQLTLLGVTSEKGANPVVHTIAVNFMAILQSTPSLKVLDHEFAADDLTKPRWCPLKDIKKSRSDGKFYAAGSELPLDDDTVKSLGTALAKTGHPLASYFRGTPSLGIS